MSVQPRFLAFSAAWASRSFPLPRESLAAVRPRSTTSAANCWPSFGNPYLKTMSRIGKKVIDLPAKVKVNVSSEGAISVEGPKGKLDWTLPKQIQARIEGAQVTIERSSEDRKVR